MFFSNQRKRADCVVLPFWQGEKHPVLACRVKEFATLLKTPLSTEDFLGKEGESLLLYRSGSKQEKRVVLLGLGPKKEATAEKLRRASGALVKLLLQKKCTEVNFFLPETKLPLISICEGILLANYSFDRYKDKPTPLLKGVSLLGADKEMLKEALKRESIISAVNMARDLVNSNADDVTPQVLSAKAEALAREFPSLKATILGKKEIEKEQMGLLLAVNRGAAQDPALILLEYRGNPSSKELTVVVGKGITFDTGGLNIKPGTSMEDMKSDMAGAAAALGILKAVAALKPKVNVVGIIPSTENAIGPCSYKPGDVYRSHAGKTVEIADTDAEGRLVLADAISFAQKKFKPTRIIDFATLTGSVVIALGEEASGLFSNNDALAHALLAAGEKTAERAWRLPIYPEYKEALKSSIADIKNVGGRKGGASKGAIFLQEFIQDIPWAHFDIAGTAYTAERKPYQPSSATGVGIRLLIEFFMNF